MESKKFLFWDTETLHSKPVESRPTGAYCDPDLRFLIKNRQSQLFLRSFEMGKFEKFRHIICNLCLERKRITILLFKIKKRKIISRF